MLKSSSPSFSTSSTPDFTAVLLAGGRSTRMGFEKANLTVAGQALWKHQLATLRATGPAELLISGRREGHLANAPVPVFEDHGSSSGPLSGLAAAMEVATYPLVLVLAVDMPRMTPEYLRRLLASGPVVPQRDDIFEPLAAVYPKDCGALAERRISENKFAIQHFVKELADAGRVSIRRVTDHEVSPFDNLNTPEDLAHFLRG